MRIKNFVLSISLIVAIPVLAIVWHSFQLLNTYRNIPDTPLKPNQVIEVGDDLFRDT